MGMAFVIGQVAGGVPAMLYTPQLRFDAQALIDSNWAAR
jgi:hypothetical protein